VDIRRLGPGDAEAVQAAGHLFDAPPTDRWSNQFLDRDGHHLLVAYEQGVPAGFVSGVEITHPDKGTEVLLYELGVDEEFRRRGIGRALVQALLDLAVDVGATNVWVPVDADNEVAIATYRSAGFDEPEPTGILNRAVGDDR
jgi:ribosomal protein S18 acetylase RimI-like enzyme